MKPIVAASFAFALISCSQAPTPAPPLPPEPLPVALPEPVAVVPTGPRDVLVLGDSQISFGAGSAYQSFLADAARSCDLSASALRPASVGVRSATLNGWTAMDGPSRDTICARDEKFGVNAGSYGITSPNRSYVQIGEADHPYCTAGRSPLQNAMAAQKPDLVVLPLLGNDTDRWQSASSARADVTRAVAQIPNDTACILMTTMPVYDATSNDKRALAQANFAAAARATRCSVVLGHTPQTRAAIEGQAQYFRTNSDGKVIDTSHANSDAAFAFIRLRQPAFCAALKAQMGG